MGGRVLVIDDDPDTCQLVRKLLGAAGHEVEATEDPHRAIAVFSEGRHDVVVTDVRMPGMDGLEVLRALKAIEPDVGVIIFSAALGDRTRLAIEALRGGADDFLIKPLPDLADLESAVQAAVRARTGRRESERRIRELERLARTDTLTGLANRLELEQRLAEEFSRLGRSLEVLSLAVFDIDRFKAINDGRGHQEGDRVLACVANALRDNCRAYDIKARFGGDEFVVVMPDTRLDQGMAVADKIRRAASALTLPGGGEPHQVTLSAGVTSTTPFEGVTPEELMRRADLALYEAKNAGRDRTLAWVQGPAAAQVLIVEGNRADAERLVQMCTSLGCGADWAATAAEAVTRAGSSRYALALVNVHLADSDGADTIRMVRDVSPQTSAALLADASPAVGGVVEALARSPVTLARKPISLDHLRALLSESRTHG